MLEAALKLKTLPEDIFQEDVSKEMADIFLKSNPTIDIESLEDYTFAVIANAVLTTVAVMYTEEQMNEFSTVVRELQAMEVDIDP